MSLPNIKKTIKRNIENSIGLLSVAGAGGGGKGKAGAGGTAKLKPPQTSDLLRSRAYMGVLDLISEGPIAGPVEEDGKLSIGTEKLSSVFFDKVSVREPKKRTLKKINIKPSDIKKIGSLNHEQLRDAVSNLKDLVEDSGIGVAEGFYYEVRASYQTSFTRNTIKTRVSTRTSSRSMFSRNSRYSTTYKTSYQDVLKFIVLDTKGYGYTEAPLLKIRRYETNSQGQRYKISPLKYGTLKTSIDAIGRIVSVTTAGDFIWPAREGCTYTTAIEEYVPIKSTTGTEKFQESQLQNYLNLGAELTNFQNAIETDRNIDSRVGFIQYEVERDVRAESLYYSPSTSYYSYHTVGEDKYERTVVDEEGNSNVEIPNGYSFIIPVIDEGTSIPERQGQVYGGVKVTSIIAGGIMPFYIGRETATGTNGAFLSGLFVTTDNEIRSKRPLAKANKRDLIALNEAGQSCYLLDCDQNQSSPPLGDTTAKPINLSYFSNFNDTFNFTDAAVRFNAGNEFQSPIAGFESSSNDIPIQKELLGRFKLGGDARKGTGNSDPRKGGDMATWTTSLPTESAEVAHTHIVTNKNVDSAIPTVIIEALGDTAAEGDDIGRTLKQKINFQVEYGFEGSQSATNYTPDNSAEEARAEFNITEGKIFRVDPNELKILKINKTEGDTVYASDINSNKNVILKKNDGTTGTFGVNDSLIEASGINETDLGDFFFVIEDFEIINSGSSYQDMDDLNLSVFGESEFIENEIDAFLNINNEGQIEKEEEDSAKKFYGGLYGGPFELVGAASPQNGTHEIQNDTPSNLESLEDQRRITLGLGEGIAIESLALSKFDQSNVFSIEGIVTSPYFLELTTSPLPKNEELRDLTYAEIGFSEDQIRSLNVLTTDLVFPGKSWENIRRSMLIRKLDFETESVLIQRSATLSHVTETMDTPFNYPFSALVSNNIDARNFTQPPERQYLTKLKLVNIPSNYCPTKADGKDKRFLPSTRESELRKLFSFTGRELFFSEGNRDYGNNLSTINFNTKLYLTSFSNNGFSAGYNSTAFEFNLSSGGAVNKDIKIYISDSTLFLKINEITSGLNIFSLPLGDTFLNQVLKIHVSFNNSNIKLSATKENGQKNEKEFFGTSLGKLSLDIDTANAENQIEQFNTNYNGKLPGVHIGGSQDMIMGDAILKLNGQLSYIFSGELIEVSTFPSFAIREKLGKHALLRELGVNPIEALNIT